MADNHITNQNQKKAPSIIIAGGGTGGHLFPGISIAQAFLERSPESRILFVGTDRPFERETLAKHGFDHQTITALGFKGLGWQAKAKAVGALLKGVKEAREIIARFQPQLVVGVGGYSSAPIALAAKRVGVPLVICEQNLRPGLTNRILARLAQRVFVAFEKTPFSGNPKKIIWTGNPVRKELLELAAAANPDETRLCLLIMGGSQGAHVINVAMMEAIKELDGSNIKIVHQTGTAELAMVQRKYAQTSIDATVRAFIHDMGRAYGEAHLLICRAGATTIAEITAVGKPALFVPFAQAADNHQQLNALPLKEAGAAEIIPENELTGERLAILIEHFQKNRTELVQMAQCARKLGRPDAAKAIVQQCEPLMISKVGC